jgi:hypothetical protein
MEPIRSEMVQRMIFRIENFQRDTYFDKKIQLVNWRWMKLDVTYKKLTPGGKLVHGVALSTNAALIEVFCIGV